VPRKIARSLEFPEIPPFKESNRSGGSHLLTGGVPGAAGSTASRAVRARSEEAWRRANNTHGVAGAGRGAPDTGDPEEDGLKASTDRPSSPLSLLDLLACVRIDVEAPACAGAIDEERERKEHRDDDAGLEGHLLA